MRFEYDMAYKVLLMKPVEALYDSYEIDPANTLPEVSDLLTSNFGGGVPGQLSN